MTFLNKCNKNRACNYIRKNERKEFWMKEKNDILRIWKERERERERK